MPSITTLIRRPQNPSFARRSPRQERSFMSLALSPDAPRRRPVVPLILIALGVALYLVGYLITYAPTLMPMLIAIQATMMGPQVCCILLALWFVLQPIGSWLFTKRTVPTS